ncbi:unnamed protein product [Fraxinus pennsylvanica]|uniref:DRBM domain-containing protein n=1 Tax=Fraxinus pennsylvanica TaxID=56036 RepID=A0AAD1ZAA5_9LAMI|nr:unnamed protein product [Fraxinus pennsylvanica]
MYLSYFLKFTFSSHSSDFDFLFTGAIIWVKYGNMTFNLKIGDKKMKNKMGNNCLLTLEVDDFPRSMHHNWALYGLVHAWEASKANFSQRSHRHTLHILESEIILSYGGLHVLFAGQKIGEGIGRTRREAQNEAAQGSLMNLAVFKNFPMRTSKVVHS